MPKVTDPYERQHIANLAKYGKLIDEIFKAATREAAAIGASVPNFDPSRVFSFSDYPITQDRVRKLLLWLENNVETAIVNGIEAEWTLANNKCSALSQRVFGDNVGRLTQAQYRRYFSSNDDARQAFLARKTEGLNLSERVWRYANDFRKDIELGLDVGIRSGLDADAMSRELRTFLQQPEKLFRRVRDEHDNLVLSRRASEYHPGQGVYRSSYKNARRLAVTETNMAYRTAEYDRIQSLDFVVGIEIRLSNNHTIHDSKGGLIPLHDICDDLKGRYPKDFKFTGWHPHCRCYVVTILKTEEELMQENAAILRGEDPSQASVNRVDDVPENFKEWVRDNTPRIARAQAVPYFMRDNLGVISDIFTTYRPSTNMATSAFGTLGDYFDEMRHRDPRLEAIYLQLNGGKLTDIERTILSNQYKSISANYTIADLRSWGMISEDMVVSKLERESVLQETINYVTSDGTVVPIRGLRRDLVVLRDKRGKEFAYPVGVQKEDVLFSAAKASDVIAGYPPYLRRGIERITFYKHPCPTDPFWKIEHKNPNHVSIATDGGRTIFWDTPGDEKEFAGYMAHEAAHILDTPLHKISSSEGWLQAVAEDDKYYAAHGFDNFRVSEYAKTNDVEDFAECIKHYITRHENFKHFFPNRAAYIRKLAQALSGRSPSRP